MATIVKEYRLLDSGNFQKLERVGDYLLVRPALQALWQPQLPESVWQSADAIFRRDDSGKGEWQSKRGRQLAPQWVVHQDGIPFIVRLTDFGHIGLFPEHYQEWQSLASAIASHKGGPFKCLNLFAYTGSLTLQLARAGAHVAHVDASKKSVDWARDNAQLAGLAQQPVRWLVDDVRKFVTKESRRQSQYDGIILDPPSFGRGAKNEVWKIEDDLFNLLKELHPLCSENFAFLFLSCHTPGISGLALQNLLSGLFKNQGTLRAGELAINEEDSSRKLPSGSFCLWLRNEAQT